MVMVLLSERIPMVGVGAWEVVAMVPPLSKQDWFYVVVIAVAVAVILAFLPWLLAVAPEVTCC